MTKRRRVLNKINARIESLAKRAGIDISLIQDRALDFDGVYITESGRLNVDAADWTDKLGERLESRIRSYAQEYSDMSDIVDEELSTFIGPLRHNERDIRIKQNIKAKYEIEDELDEFFNEFYGEVMSSLPLSRRLDDDYLDFERRLSEMGGALARQELPYTQIQELFEEAKQLMGGFK